MMKSVLKGREIRLRMNHLRQTDQALCVQGVAPAESWSVQLFRSIDSGEGLGDFVGRGKGRTAVTYLECKNTCVCAVHQAACIPCVLGRTQ